MSAPEFIRTPQFDHAQAVRFGDRLELAGQGGWDAELNFPSSIEDEISQAFRNISQILDLAGASWRNVVSIVSYHVDLDGNQDLINTTMADHFRTHMPHGFPTWTCLGVAALGSPKMQVEIRASAVLF